MRKERELVVSQRFHDDIKLMLDNLAKELRKQMDIVESDTCKVSIDINLLMPGPAFGIKYSFGKFNRVEKVYDFEDLK